jgi:hypothetical protein
MSYKSKNSTSKYTHEEKNTHTNTKDHQLLSSVKVILPMLDKIINYAKSKMCFVFLTLVFWTYMLVELRSARLVLYTVSVLPNKLATLIRFTFNQ